MPPVSNLRALDDAAGTAIAGQNDVTASFNSEWFVCPTDIVGILLSVTRDSGTLDVKLELSDDGGTTSYAFPDDFNSETQAALASITTTKTTCEYWKNPLPRWSKSSGDSTILPRARFVFTITTGQFDFAKASVLLKDFQ